VTAGVSELLGISQDTGVYGRDLRYRTDFRNGRPLRTDIETLVQILGKLPVWVRLHYLHPYPRVDTLISTMATDRILPYPDIPLQHASPRILEAMRRPAAGEWMLARIAGWRKRCPELVIRSTFIVGFPGETESNFESLLEFLEVTRLDRVGGFAYSPVVGAAANVLPDQLPQALREERLARLMAVQAAISREKLQARVGRRPTVLVDEVAADQVIARSYADVPEIDSTVIILGP